MTDTRIQEDIQTKVRSQLFPLFLKYQLDLDELETVLKWKPIVLFLGNYSSGKSTLVNELLGREIQRTGQAPTDDSFTVITSSNTAENNQLIPGATLVNDIDLPFSIFKGYGEKFISHLFMKKVNLPVLENLAIIDSPGMVDSVTEKGRGYDFKAVVGDFARIADLIVLMFDPHKAGTIKEMYSTIRNTLPETSGEDRIAFVMSRIDECDNLGDLVRSYGTLCWNLSQMTGRKDIPRIFLTFSPVVTRQTKKLEVWVDERNQLKRKILDTPKLRISHILHNVDKQVNRLKMVVEAMASFSGALRRSLTRMLRTTVLAGLIAFFFSDFLAMQLIGFPSDPLFFALFSGHLALYHLIVPGTAVLVLFLLCFLLFFKWRFPRLRRKYSRSPDALVTQTSDYHRHKWLEAKETVQRLILQSGLKDLGRAHTHNLEKIEKFIEEELRSYYSR
jgi:GTPase SAR1 family protein